MDKTCLACRLFFHTVQNIYMHKTGQQYIQEKETEKTKFIIYTCSKVQCSVIFQHYDDKFLNSIMAYIF